MLKALAWKESYELLPSTVLALLVQLILVAAAMGVPLLPYIEASGVIPFYQDTLCGMLLFVAALASGWIGLRQSGREASHGTFLFLLHRPATREAIVGTKLAVGLAAFLVIAGLPLTGYALWAAMPATHASPFLWSMTTWAWVILAQLPMVYLAGFLSGLRPGHWFGTRLLPLLGSLAVLILAQVGFAWPWASLACCLAIDAALVLAIFEVAATRDYS